MIKKKLSELKEYFKELVKLRDLPTLIVAFVSLIIATNTYFIYSKSEVVNNTKNALGLILNKEFSDAHNRVKCAYLNGIITIQGEHVAFNHDENDAKGLYPDCAYPNECYCFVEDCNYILSVANYLFYVWGEEKDRSCIDQNAVCYVFLQKFKEVEEPFRALRQMKDLSANSASSQHDIRQFFQFLAILKDYDKNKN